MPKISILRETDVPDGLYCVDYGSDPEIERCQQLRSTSSSVGWADGLGSPGTITNYQCALFDAQVGTCYPHEGFNGLTVMKCSDCIKHNGPCNLKEPDYCADYE